MCEVVGKCLSVDNDKMIILDDDNDEIEMYFFGLTGEKLNEVVSFCKGLINKRVSFFYDINGVKIKEIKN